MPTGMREEQSPVVGDGGKERDEGGGDEGDRGGLP